MNSKEQVIYFLQQGKIRLSQYDQKFLSNLQHMIHKDERVTSNQANLVDVLITKYSRQLSRLGQISKDLSNLPWNSMVVESTADYTNAKISLEDEEIFIRVPFNKRFINNFGHIKDNPFAFDKQDGLYKAQFSTLALKLTTTALHKYFSAVQYCETLEPLLTQIEEYGNGLTWNPTLIKVNGQLMVAACNEVIGNLIRDTELKQDAATFYKLSQYGITIHPDLTETPKLKFAAEYRTEVDLDNANEMADWIKELSCNTVCFSSGSGITIRNTLTEVFKVKGIEHLYPPKRPSIKDDFMMIRHSSSSSLVSSYYSKIIIIRNSRPVEVK